MAPNLQVTNSKRGSPAAPSGESRPKPEPGGPRTPPNHPGAAGVGRPSPPVGVPQLAGPRPQPRALCLSDPRSVEPGARGAGSPPRLSTAPGGVRAGVEKAPRRLWRWANCGRSFSKFLPEREARGVGIPLGDLPSRRGRPRGSRAPRPARREPTSEGAPGRGSGGREGGRRALPRVHTQ